MQFVLCLEDCSCMILDIFANASAKAQKSELSVP